VLRITFLKPEQAMIGCRFKINGPKNIDEPDFRRRPCEYETALVPFLSFKDTGSGQSSHDLGKKRQWYTYYLSEITGTDSFVAFQAGEVNHSSQRVFGWPAQVHLFMSPLNSSHSLSHISKDLTVF
jgi:hypothetical protein